jgi:hypothetical protein
LNEKSVERPVTAYGLYYLNNQPTLLRAIDLSAHSSGLEIAPTLHSAPSHGFNAVRIGDRQDETTVVSDLALVSGETPGMTLSGSAAERPFGVSLQAARAGFHAQDEGPSTLWGLPARAKDVLMAVARGVRGYSVSNGAGDASLTRLQVWLGEHEEEIASSVEVKDALAFLDYAPYQRLNEGRVAGAFGALVCAGYNPTLMDLELATDESLSEFPAALLPCGGFMDVPNYGKLVVLTLRGATFVTLPEPVSRQIDGSPLKTTFLWPQQVPATHRSAGSTRAGEMLETPTASSMKGEGAMEVGRMAQVRDGTSTLLTVDVGQPYASDAYYRLPSSQREAIRLVLVSLFSQAVRRQVVPGAGFEAEMVARLSPDGGALLFIANRLDTQRGEVALPFPEALNLGADWSAELLFGERGSTAMRNGDTLALELVAGDAVVIRLR